MAVEVYKIKIELVGFGTVLGELIRLNSPITAERIMKKLPINIRGRFIGGKKFFIIPVGIEKGAELEVKSLKRGDIGYSPEADALVLAREDGEFNMGVVAAVGRITSGVEVLDKIPRSSTVIIEPAD